MDLWARESGRKRLAAAFLLLAVGVVANGLAAGGDAWAVDQRKHPPGAGRPIAKPMAIPMPRPLGPNTFHGLPNGPDSRLTGVPRPGQRAPGLAHQGPLPGQHPGFERRNAILAAQQRLPRRPLPGERGFTGVPPRGETRFVSNEMVFQVGPNVSPQAVDSVARRLALSAVGSQVSVAGGTLLRFRINDGRPVADVIRALEAEKIGVAQPNYVYKLQQDQSLAGAATRGDPAQYVVSKLRLAEVHRIARGTNVVVAVIDSVIDARHPDLAGTIVEQFDAVGRNDKPDVHGTGMAGAIAAHRRLMGVAPDARILAIHAFSPNSASSPEATTEHILKGLDWAIKKGARIINMSFAGPYDPMLQLALKKAHEKGVVLIAAAGNLGPKSPPLYPAADEHVIAVTATDENDRVLNQANRGPYIAVAAPGVDILEPAPNAGYQVTTGTSVAAAHVSGIAALLIERNPAIDAASVREILSTSAKHMAAKGRDDQFGWGLVDPYRALAAADAKVARDRPASPAAEAAGAKPKPVSARSP